MPADERTGLQKPCRALETVKDRGQKQRVTEACFEPVDALPLLGCQVEMDGSPEKNFANFKATVQLAKILILDEATRSLEKGSKFSDRLRLFNLATQCILASAAPTLVASRTNLAKVDSLQVGDVSLVE